MNNAWIRRDNFVNNTVDSCAFSTSYYSPAGTANDFMWTPLINLPEYCELSWRAMTSDGAYQDGYEVRIMTVPPTGAIGDIGNQLTNSTLLFSTSAEASSWTTRKVKLDTWARQSVYIGFRNNSLDKFLLMIDNIKVEVVINSDAQVLYNQQYEYAQYPLSQVANLPLGGTIRNLGLQPLTHVSLRAEVYNSSGALVHAQTSAPVTSLSYFASTNYVLSDWTPPATGQYTIKYFPLHDSVDMVHSNDTLYSYIYISDSVYARDNGIIVGGLGIGLGNGFLGQAFTLNNTADLQSVTISYNRGYTGRKYGLVVWDLNTAGVPNTIIAATDTLLYTDDNAFIDTVPIYGGKKKLTPGTYVITAIEFDSTISVSQTDGVFTPGKLWVQFTGQSWANLETFGVQFGRSFYIRMNISSQSLVPLKLVSFTGHPSPEGNELEWVVDGQENIKAYDIERSVNGTAFKKIGTVTANKQLSWHYDFTDRETLYGVAYYRLKIVEDNQVTYSKMIRIQSSANATLSIAPNPVKQTFTLQSNNQQLLNTEFRVFNNNGQSIKRFRITSLPLSVDTQTWLPGTYFLQLYDNSILKIMKQ